MKEPTNKEPIKHYHTKFIKMDEPINVKSKYEEEPFETI